MHPDFARQSDFPNALNGFAKYLRLELELLLIGNVLVVAASTLLEVRAAGLDPL